MKRLATYKEIFLFTTIFIFLMTGLWGQEILKLDSYPSVNAVVPAQNFRVAVVANILEPWHINSNQPLDDYTIATEVRISDSEHYTVKNIKFPEHEIVHNEALDKELALFGGETIIILNIDVAEKIAQDSVTVAGNLYYQGCNDATCLAPREKQFSVTLPLVNDKSAVEKINRDYFAQGVGQKSAQEQQTGQIESKEEFNVEESFSRRGTFLTFLLIFLGGLGLVLTPCIYPMIPITVSYFGGQTGGKKSQRFIMALLYVLGLATTNSILGTLAALSGGLVGGLLSNPFVLLGIAAILVALALSMFGLYDITVPSALNQLGSGNQGGYLGSIIMGLTLGIVAAPCIGPFIIGLLTYVAAVGNPFLGFAMFFTLSMGMGLPFLLLGYFSSQLDKLPQAGEWMVGVRRIFGLVLLGMALYFLQALIPDNVYGILFPAFLLVSGVYLLFFEKSGEQNKVFAYIKRIISVVAIFAAGWFMQPEQEPMMGSMEWQKYEQQAYQEAVADQRPVILDFTADWCVKCKELEEITFKDSEVVQLSRNFHLFKVDLTRRNSARSERIREKFDIKGLPTIIFINEEGEEIEELRIFGFVKPDEFVKRMEKLIEK